MNHWSWVPLEQLAADERSAISKPYGSAIFKEDYRDHGVPVVRGVNLAKGIFHDDDFVFIDDELAARMPGAEMMSGDLVITHRGTVGQVSMIPRSSRFPRYIASTSHVKVRLDPGKAVSEFYYYWFAAPQGQHSILSNVSTVGVPGLVQPVATVKKLQVPWPRPAEQRAIAEVLGALDDKIVANEKAVKHAVDLADSLFAQTVASTHVLKSTYEEIAEIGGGGTPNTGIERYWGGPIAWSTPTDVTSLNGPYLDTTSRTLTDDGLTACSSPLYPAGSILMTSRATIGAFAIAQVPVAVNQGFIVVNAKDESLQWWVFHDMRSRLGELLSYANGATFLELSRGKFKKLSVRLPSPEQVTRFGETVGALHRVGANLQRGSRHLARTRDELLPLLMSGKVRVKDAEAAVSEIV